jgi:DnaK suppressor protein
MAADAEKASKRLSARKAELEEQSEMTREARAPVELDQQAVGRLSRMDAIQQQKLAEAAERSRKRDLVRIEMAERRLASGDYGYCVECGEEIPDGRLAIDPMAEKCVNCAGR